MFYYMKQWVGLLQNFTPFSNSKTRRKRKIKQRDGAKFGFPVFPMNFYDEATGETYKGYKEEGYLPEAFVNFLAL